MGTLHPVQFHPVQPFNPPGLQWLPYVPYANPDHFDRRRAPQTLLPQRRVEKVQPPPALKNLE